MCHHTSFYSLVSSNFSSFKPAIHARRFGMGEINGPKMNKML